MLVPIERLILKIIGVDPGEQQNWKRYSVSLLVSNVFMLIYGLGGVLLPFAGIKAIDLLLVAAGLA